MAYSSTTENYKLPQIEGADEVNWFDLNGAFSTIDTAMESNKQNAITANQKADNNTSAIEALNESVLAQGEKLNSSVADLSNLEQTVELHTTHLNEIDAINGAQNVRITAIENTTGDVAGKVETLEGGVSEIDNRINTVSQNIAKAETEIQSLQSITDGLTDDINNLSPSTTRVDISITSTSPAGVNTSTARLRKTDSGKWWVEEIVCIWPDFHLNNTIQLVFDLPQGLTRNNFVPVPVQIYGASSDYAYCSPAIAGLGVEGTGARLVITNFSGRTENTGNRSVSIKGFHW